MSRQLIIQPLAEADIDDAAQWYQEQQFGVGIEFLMEVREALQRLMANPLVNVRLLREPDVRRTFTKRFPFRIFYVLRPDAVVVFRVLHGARDDGQWKARIPRG